MKTLKKGRGNAADSYSEESPRVAIIMAFVLVLLVGTPLALANLKVIEAGSRANDVSTYVRLAKQLDANVAAVREVVGKGVVTEAVITGEGVKGTTLITPLIAPTNIHETSSDSMEITLSAIYWNPHDPLVTINNENYHIGDKVKGFTIIEIRKTEVVFRSPAGEKVVKYFYDDL